MTVLVLTRPELEATADLVIDELNGRRIPVHRLDPGAFPESLGFSAAIGAGADDWQGDVRGQYRDLRLEDVRAVYYRRPGPFRLHPRLAGPDARWADAEARAGFGGILASLRCVWVNHPFRNAAADCQPLALAAARRCGLAVPRTVVTNEPETAREFVRSLPTGTAAYKPLGNAGPVGADGETVAVWTSRVAPDDITDAVARTAHLFQEWIDKAFEVRLTAVGSRVFASEIHAGSPESRIDFRRDYGSLTYRICPVPAPVAAGVRALMNTFALNYVALDFLVDAGGSWFLVDVNPNGQYAFVPDLLSPITHALADLLEGKAP
ncbi:ATP-grasp ribosomal peptide maturase [Streptomyces sp. NPDC001889]